MSDFVIDYVTDNGDNSLTIIGHTADGTEYTTGAGRLSDLPTKKADQMIYYQNMLNDCLPPETPVLYQTPEYTAKLEAEAAAEAQAAADAAVVDQVASGDSTLDI